MGADLTSYDSVLKEHYTNERIEMLVYKDNPFLALLSKYEKFGGTSLPIPLIYGNPQGRSATFANAQTRGAATSSRITDFSLTRVKDYSIATIDNETLEASKGNANAFIDAVTTEIDGAFHALTRSLAVSLFRTSAGYVGQVSVEPTENASTFVITLSEADDVTNFELDQVVVIWSAVTAGTQRTSDGSDDEWVIAAIDRSAGTLTLSGTYSASGTIAANDYIFIEGDRGLKVSGLLDWIPVSAPSATAFFGVSRNVDSTRLGGIRHDGSAQSIEEGLISLASKIAREGGKPEVCFMNYAKYAELEKSLGSKVQYVDLEMNAKIGFRGISVQGPRGPIKVIADHNCPSPYGWMLQMDTWKLYSLGKAVRSIDTDGMEMLRQSAADGVEARIGFYGNLGCSAPGYNGIITF